MQTALKLEWLGSAAGEGLGTAGDHEQIVNQQLLPKPKQFSFGDGADRVCYMCKPQEAITFPYLDPEKLQLEQGVSSCQQICFKKLQKPLRELDRFKQMLVRGSQGTQR